jgi:hypothetical protein
MKKYYYPHECQGATGFKAAATKSLDTEVAPSVGVQFPQIFYVTDSTC